MASLSALMILIAQATGLGPDHVEVGGARWAALRAEPDPEPGFAWAQRRELDLELTEDGVHLHGRWTILGRGPEPSRYFLGELLPAAARIERARWNAAPASLWTTGNAVTVAGLVGDRAVLEVDAFLPASPASGVSLGVLDATTGTVRVKAPFPVRVTASDPDVVLPDGDQFVTGAAELTIAERRESEAAKSTVVVSRTAMGLTVGDDTVQGYARATWFVRRGSLARVSFTAAHLGADLEVLGENVASWKQSGDRFQVELKTPATEAVRLQLRWTTPIDRGAESSLSLPAIVPEAALHHEATLELARDGEVDAVPSVPGWTPLASQQLPDWSRGLIRGAATAAYRRAEAGAAEAGRLDLFRFEPVAGPKVVVDIADVHVTTAASGRTLMRARYEVTNERADALEITPPAGAELVGAWVAGRRVAVARVEERLRIPLTRSIETVDGLLGFPVMVAFIGESPEWKRREERDLGLPRVHAPVNVERVTLRLPRHYRSRLEPGEDGAVVESFTRGDDVAYGLDDQDRIATADVIYRDAIDAWNANDFERARQRLGELEQIGAQSENQEGLEGNVEILLTGPLAGAPAVMKKSTGWGGGSRDKRARRIRAQAKARSGQAQQEQRQFKKKAQALKSEGRYEEAAEEYQKALDATAALRNLDEEESQAYEFEADQLQMEMESNQAEAEAREQLEYQSKLWSGGGFASTPRRPAPPLSAIAPIVLPEVGETVRYQFVLLEPGATRAVPIDARKRRSHRRRKELSR